MISPLGRLLGEGCISLLSYPLSFHFTPSFLSPGSAPFCLSPPPLSVKYSLYSPPSSTAFFLFHSPSPSASLDLHLCFSNPTYFSTCSLSLSPLFFLSSSPPFFHSVYVISLSIPPSPFLPVPSPFLSSPRPAARAGVGGMELQSGHEPPFSTKFSFQLLFEQCEPPLEQFCQNDCLPLNFSTPTSDPSPPPSFTQFPYSASFSCSFLLTPPSISSPPSSLSFSHLSPSSLSPPLPLSLPIIHCLHRIPFPFLLFLLLPLTSPFLPIFYLSLPPLFSLSPSPSALLCYFCNLSIFPPLLSPLPPPSP